MKKVLIIMSVLLTLTLTGCASMHVSDEQLAKFDGNSWIKKDYDNFDGVTNYNATIPMMYEIENPLSTNTMGTANINVTKIVKDNGGYKIMFGSMELKGKDWMYAYQIIFLFDGKPYKLDLEPQQTDVTSYAGVQVHERYTMNITDDFLKRYINATKINWKIYTKNQGTFTSYKLKDKSIPETKNYYKELDKVLTEMINK